MADCQLARPQPTSYPQPTSTRLVNPHPRRRIIILVKAGAPVDATVAQLAELLEAGDIIIDGGNEWCVRVRAAYCGGAATGMR